MVCTGNYSSPLFGPLLMAGDGDRLIGLWLKGQKYSNVQRGEDWPENSGAKIFSLTGKWLDAYFAGRKPAVSDLPLAPRGGEFRQAVWDLLLKIPYGGLATYGEIAEAVAARLNKNRMSAQAVGGAVGHNPISIIIPCHRVVGANGSLTGYAGGIDKKLWLLRHEGVDVSRFFIPKKGTAL